MKRFKSPMTRASLLLMAMVATIMVTRYARATIMAHQWTIFFTNPPQNMNYHYPTSVLFGSDHNETYHLIQSPGQTDTVTTYAKNGYTSLTMPIPVLVGYDAVSASLSGSGDYYWSPRKLAAGDSVTPMPGSYIVWWKTNWCSNGGAEMNFATIQGGTAYLSTFMNILPPGTP